MSQNTANKNISQGKSRFKDFLTINDLRDKDYTNQNLSPNERLALKNFDRYRIAELNKQRSENDFHAKYLQLQVMSNLNPYDEFLKESYFI
jgi:hypothetical protein